MVSRVKDSCDLDKPFLSKTVKQIRKDGAILQSLHYPRVENADRDISSTEIARLQAEEHFTLSPVDKVY